MIIACFDLNHLLEKQKVKCVMPYVCCFKDRFGISCLGQRGRISTEDGLRSLTPKSNALLAKGRSTLLLQGILGDLFPEVDMLLPPQYQTKFHILLMSLCYLSNLQKKQNLKSNAGSYDYIKHDIM